MFTIEHDFDATVITLIDEAEPGERPLNADVVILTFDDRVVVEQVDHDDDESEHPAGHARRPRTHTSPPARCDTPLTSRAPRSPPW